MFEGCCSDLHQFLSNMWRFLYHMKKHIFMINILKFEHQIRRNYRDIYDKVAFIRIDQRNSVHTTLYPDRWGDLSGLKPAILQDQKSLSGSIFLALFLFTL